MDKKIIHKDFLYVYILYVFSRYMLTKHAIVTMYVPYTKMYVYSYNNCLFTENKDKAFSKEDVWLFQYYVYALTYSL